MTNVMTFFELAREILVNIGGFVFSTEAAGAAAVLGTTIAIYQFFYLRPELILDVDISGWHNRSEHVNATIAFYVINAGHRFAEDVQISITADAFKFDNDTETTSTMSEEYGGVTAEFEIKSGRKAGYIGGGRRHDINIGNPIYEGEISKLYFGSAIFEEDGLHELKYKVACRSHGMRAGKITFKVDGNNSRVLSKKHPTVLRNIKARLYWKPELTRVQTVENL
jgi:hypothetical protein